jgi:large subunit ribosomal protein L23
MKAPDKVLKEFRVTEKANQLASNLNQYTFEVFTDANRISVAQAVESVFKVEVQSVNILYQKPKTRRDRSNRGKRGVKSGFKKAIVTLKAGDKIELI